MISILFRRNARSLLLAAICLALSPAALAAGNPQSPEGRRTDQGQKVSGHPAAPSAAQQAAPQPRLVIDSTSLDLGEVPEGEEVTAEFVIKNAGEAELKILKAKPS